MAEIALILLDAVEGGGMAGGILHPAEPAHHRRSIQVSDEGRAIGAVPATQDQPFGGADDICHATPMASGRRAINPAI